VVMIFKVVAASSSNGVELMIGQHMTELAA
jgi:hypothetical protein